MFCGKVIPILTSLMLVLVLGSPSLATNVVAFGDPQIYSPFGGPPTSVAVADVNGDGFSDLVVTGGTGGFNQGTVTILLGNGDGTFRRSSGFDSGGGWASSIVVVDLNNDGKSDLVVANCGNGSRPDACPDSVSDGVVAIFLGNGNGTFQAPRLYDTGGGGALSVVTADLNGDGKLDVLVANDCADKACTLPGGPSILLGNGDGTLQAAVTYSGGLFAVADINLDGKPDIVSDSGTGRIIVWIGVGDGTFQLDPNFYRVPGRDPARLVIVDVNHDGKPDVVAVSDQLHTGAISVLIGNGDGTFGVPVTFPSGGDGFSESFTVADVNADGNPDILVASCGVKGVGCGATTPGVVSVHAGKSNGTFLRGPALFSSGGFFANSVTVADLDKDTRPDLIVTDFFSSDVSVLIDEGVYPTSTSLVSNKNPSHKGESVTFTATVASAGPTPAGIVAFKSDGTGIGKATLHGGIATLIKILPVGTHSITATYRGDTVVSGQSTSSVLMQTVQP